MAVYTATVDGLTLYSPNNGFNLFNAKVTQELNKVGAFDFTIYPDHPAFEHIAKLKSVVTVRDRQQIIFRGRVINSEEGWNNQQTIECESDLAYLLDSVQRPYSYSGTLKGYFEQLIANHNAMVEESKRFTVGNVTVTDSNDTVNYSSTEYPTTWDEINKKLIETHGGYIFVRYGTDGTTYIDYLDDFNLLSNQPVTFGTNLLDMARKVRGEEIATACIPLGAKIETEGEESRLTIEAVNGGLDYVYDEDAVDAFGWIFCTNTWDDVTVATNLRTKALAYLGEKVLLGTELELSAVDLSALDADYSSFHLGTYVKVTSGPHGVDGNFLVSKLNIDINDPTANTLNLGATGQTITDIIQGNRPDIGGIVEEVTGQVGSDITVQLQQVTQTVVNQAADSILQQVSENYYTVNDAGELEELVSSLSSTVKQTAEGWTFNFNEMQKDLEDLQNGVDAEFSDISRYIRFINGVIELGEAGNPIVLRIENDEIGFYQGGNKVAYFSDSKLYVLDAEILSRLKLGAFAFIPRDNGNLSLRYVG